MVFVHIIWPDNFPMLLSLFTFRPWLTSHRLVVSSTSSQPNSRHNMPVPTWQFEETCEHEHVTLANSLMNFTEVVECPTKDNKSLDLLYAIVKEGYSSDQNLDKGLILW